MDTDNLIGTWRVISFTVRYNTTETPEGWAEFIFDRNGVVTQKVTRQEMQTSHHGAMRWQIQGEQIIIFEDDRPTWYVKHLSPTDMVLSQGNDAELSYRLRKFRLHHDKSYTL